MRCRREKQQCTVRLTLVSPTLFFLLLTCFEKKKYFELLQVTVKAELKFPCKAAKRVESVVVDGGELPFRMQSDEGGLRT